jgi:hypothetical protein
VRKYVGKKSHCEIRNPKHEGITTKQPFCLQLVGYERPFHFTRYAQLNLIVTIRRFYERCHEVLVIAECTERVLFAEHKDKCLTCIPREAFVFKAKFWCRLPVSNWPPDDYKSTALPNELSRRDL